MKRKILFGLSGSIACFKACSLISKLAQNGFEVKTVLTPSALKFIGPATLEGLTGHAPLIDTFESGHQMDHIRLNRWADLILLCPASANTLNKMANGIGDDLWTTLFLAHDFSKPYVIAPAMNATMLQHPATQQSLQKLQAWGITVLRTGHGVLACGEEGYGKLLEPDFIFTEIQNILKQEHVSRQRPLRVLITAGGTREPIDGVRAITNTSSGKTGAFLADYFAEKGHQVTLLHGQGAVEAACAVTTLTFTTYDDLDAQLQSLLRAHRFDLVIHAAAVSDYSVDSIVAGSEAFAPNRKLKLSSEHDRVELRLRRNPKILSRLKSYAGRLDFLVVGFKLTQTEIEAEREQAAQQIAQTPGVDFVVLNDLSEVGDSQHRSTLYKGSHIVTVCETKLQMAEALEHAADRPEELI